MTVLACLMACGMVLDGQGGGDVRLAHLLRWLDAAQQHMPGQPDAWATEVASWKHADLLVLASDVRKLATFAQKARDGAVQANASLTLYGRRFTVADVLAVFHGNDTVRSGAVLHADIAVFILDDNGSRTDETSVFVIDDGRRSGERFESSHWEIGRAVLDAAAPSTRADPGSLVWYRGVSAYLLREGHLGAARQHLDRALKVFPDDPDLLIDAAYLHQKYSSVTIQAAAQDLRMSGSNPMVDSRRGELDQAERLFRAGLATAPANPGARVRFGHTLGELGRHEEAAAELRKVIDARPEGELLYFAELFLGREEQALGHTDAARREYENAAELYPRAQSPYLAMSHLARQSGDREGALRALRTVTRLPPNDNDRWDPWWEYYEVHREDVARLMSGMRELAARRQ